MNEDKKALLLLQQLSRLPAFQEWRDLVAKPLLFKYESVLRNADEHSEVIVRATLKQYFTLKAEFDDWKIIVDQQLKDINEEEKKGI